MMRCNRHHSSLVSEQVHRVVECNFIKVQSSGLFCCLHEETLVVNFPAVFCVFYNYRLYSTMVLTTASTSIVQGCSDVFPGLKVSKFAFLLNNISGFLNTVKFM